VVEIRVGVQLYPMASVDHLREVWRRADGLGVDSIWLWDHFFPVFGDPNAPNFEAYTLLAALAVDTTRARIGALVTCNSYRNPNLLADMARTIDHLSEGRFVLGIGSGWFERDYVEYGYTFGTASERIAHLREALPIIKARLAKLNPAPVGPVPILIAGSGEKLMLRLVAEHADAWNAFGPADNFAKKSKVLDQWCERLGRDPTTIERTITISAEDTERWEEFVTAGATHLIVITPAPFDLDTVGRLVQQVRT